MCVIFKDIQRIIKDKYPTALYVHYSVHSLNLAFAHSRNVQQIHNCKGTVKSVGNFIKNSTIRTEVFKKNNK